MTSTATFFPINDERGVLAICKSTANLSDINDGGRALSEHPFIIVPITTGSIDCPSITLATRVRCGLARAFPPLSPWDNITPSLFPAVHPPLPRTRESEIFGPMNPSRFGRRVNGTHQRFANMPSDFPSTRR